MAQRMTRLFRILSYLSPGTAVPIEDLLEEIDVDEELLLDDLELLRVLPIDLILEGDGCRIGFQGYHKILPFARPAAAAVEVGA